MTKIDIISGFLGAGKTTLIKKFLAEVFAKEKVVLIENEFGEIGIDGGFLKDSGVEITEMNSGCICCSLVGDFGESLKEVLGKFAPDRIIIEPSGVGKLSDVIKAVQDVQKERPKVVRLNNYITVADATKVRLYMKNFGEFFNNQIENANAIILSRTGKMNQERLEMAVKLIQEHNDRAPVITTPWEELTGSQIMSAVEKAHSLKEDLIKEEAVSNHHHHHHHHEENCGCEHGHEHHHGANCGCGHDHHHAEDVFTSWGVETPHQYTEAELHNILEILSDTETLGTVLRAKGIVSGAAGKWFYFDLVPGEFDIREGSSDYTGRLCVIGSDLKKDKLEELFLLA